MLSLLVECTVLMLKAICEMYSIQRITYSEFISFTEKKLQFLMENMGSFVTDAERNKALDILDKCMAIIAENENRLIPSLAHTNFGIIQ